MGFNKDAVISYSQGTRTPFSAGISAFKGCVIPLLGVTAGSTASVAGLVIQMASSQFNVDNGALAAVIETNLTTTGITALLKWQVSNDNVAWLDLFGSNLAANVIKAPTGTGTNVTTQWAMALNAINPAFPYLRIAVQVGGATGAAGDNVTCSYNYRKRWHKV